MRVSGHGQDRLVGTCLAVAAVVAVLAMQLHPYRAHGSGAGDTVHGVMLIVLTVQCWALSYYALRRGPRSLLVLAGLVAYWLNLSGDFGAVTINGFVVPALAARGPGDVGHDLLLAAWESNQAFARLSVYATGVAFAAWSTDLLADRARVRRWVGALGMFCGAIPAVMLLTDTWTLDVRMAPWVTAIHAAWLVAIAALVALDPGLFDRPDGRPPLQPQRGSAPQGQ